MKKTNNNLKKSVFLVVLAFIFTLNINSAILSAASGDNTSVPQYKISGFIAPDFEYNPAVASVVRAGFEIEIVGTGLTVQTNSEGYFEVSNVATKSGGYVIKISKANYLTRFINDVEVVSDTQVSTQCAPTYMWAGDIQINGAPDGIINYIDALYMSKLQNSTVNDGVYDAAMDFDKDNVINETDVVIISKHYNQGITDYTGNYSASPWKADTYYSLNSVVQYNGNIYTCKTVHTSLPGWEPSNVPALWEKQLPSVSPPVNIWKSNTRYALENVVYFNGNVYECINPHVSADDWTPATTPTLWKMK